MAQEQPAPFPDTAHFLDAANDSARNFRAVYVTYLIIASYIAVTIFSADDELLFRAGNVQIPIINTSATVEGFFTFAPWILFLLHINVLMQAMFLSTKVHRYTSALDDDRNTSALDDDRNTSALDDDRNTSAFCIKKIDAPGLLFPAPLAHFLVAGDQRKGAQWILWVVVVFISIVLLSPGILIYAEIHFLTYQSESITWWHRAAILLDIILLWCLWPRIIAPDKGWKEWWRKSPWNHWVAAFASVATGLFILVIADIPSGTMGNLIYANTCLEWPVQDCRYKLERRILVQEEPPPEILATHLAACKFQNPDGRTDCQTKIKPGSLIWCRHAKSLPLQERAFKHANLRDAILCDADLRLAKLQGANLSFAALQGADLTEATLQDTDLFSTALQDANLYQAELQDADLRKAELQGADLRYVALQNTDLRKATLQGADLRYAALQGANLYQAELQGADLRYAALQGANLYQAELQDANLTEVKLQGADLTEVALQGAYLRWAELQGADLTGAKLQGADLTGAKLQGADLTEATLQGADLTEATLQGADLRYVALQDADLRWAKLQGADLTEAKLQGADLTETELQGADLRKAYLAGSDLSNTNLNLADLRDVDLESKSDISNANLNLADLRGVDLESKSDQEQLQKAIAIIKSIKQQELRDQALESVKRAETEKATIISPSSIEDAIFNKDDALYKRLQEPENQELLQTDHFTQTKEDDYNTKLAAYLIDSLSCRDENSYVAEGIIRSRIIRSRNILTRNIQAWIFGIENENLTSIFAKKLNLDSKVPILLCPGVEKHLDGLFEEERIQLRKIFAESANQ